ncbi:MAG: 3-isopropylmalate dehydratase large subunit [Candidatus Neomarinimicrobiota bacterium]|nr:MAG: 3-isopropylmalate dehydratase large subunit [Candidatus Neomarinimicrobiota bacterium]
MGETFAEKVFSRKAGRKVKAGEFVEVEPDVAMSHDNTAAISKTFLSIGVDKVHNPDRHVVILDHCVPPADEKFARNHKEIREFVRKFGIKNFYDINTGICHQVMHEKGYVWPGALIVGSDSHTTSYGAFGAFSTGIGRSEMAVIMATGKMWFRVPETIRVHVEGEFPDFVGPKDLMLKIAGEIGADGALYKAVEYCGPTIEKMGVAGRFVLANMSVEIGAKAGYMIPNDEVLEYVRRRVKREFEVIKSDEDAEFEKEYKFDVSDLSPMVARPHTVDNVVPVSEVKGTKVDMVFFGSCTNARLEDFEEAVKVLGKRKFSPNVRVIIIPASMEIYKGLLKRGILEKFIDAGAVVLNPGCGPCMGNHEGVPADGEIVISTSNRNFKGRMGNRNSEIYLASPQTCVASGIYGEIVDVRELS